MEFVLRSTTKAMGEHGIKWESIALLDLDYADNLSILDLFLVPKCGCSNRRMRIS